MYVSLDALPLIENEIASVGCLSLSLRDVCMFVLIRCFFSVMVFLARAPRHRLQTWLHLSLTTRTTLNVFLLDLDSAGAAPSLRPSTISCCADEGAEEVTVEPQ